MSAARSRPLKASRSRSNNAAPSTASQAAEVGPRPRESSYRGLTRAAAAEAYHADALVMARMGYAPTSEEWSTELQHVLLVGYRYAPDEAPAVLSALAEARAEPIVDPPSPETLASSLHFRMPSAVPLDAKIGVGALGGLSTGVALCFALGAVANEAPDALTLGAFGIVGLLLGFVLGMTRD